MHGEKQIYRILIRPVILHGLVNRVLRTKNKTRIITGSEKIHGEAFGLTFEGVNHGELNYDKLRLGDWFFEQRCNVEE